MNKFQKINSITNQIYFLVTSSFFIGIIFTYMWSSSNHEWKFFLKNSYHSGVSIYSSIKYGINLDNKIKIEKLEFNEEFIQKINFNYIQKFLFQ